LTAADQVVTNREKIVDELEKMRRRRAEWEILEAQYMNAEKALLEKTQELEKRVGELDCLYSISDLIENEDSLENILRGTVNLLPSAMEFPEHASARLCLYGQEYKTDAYRETYWKLVRPIFVRGAGAGFLELNYAREPDRGDRPVFRESEQKLFRSVAERLGRIVERKEAEERLRESEEKYATVVESARDGIVIIQDRVFKYANMAMAELSGYPVDALNGMPFLDIFTPDQRDLIHERYELRLSGGQTPPPVYETKIQRHDGTQTNVEISFTVIRFDGKPADMGFVRDITDRIKAEEEIRKLAYHDPLTGVPNRFLFNEQFNLARARAFRYSERIALLLLDLDKFKEINDTLGHKMGDLLLQAVGRRLQELVRKEDVVARIGGDEFIVLLQEIRRQKDAETMAEKIVHAFRQPFHIEGHDLSVTTSVGIALYPDHGGDLDLLMKNADKAMYTVKTESRDGFRTYGPDPA
jgi:diguanylate cyclase (GGDEF)-like protein/PAS domain S-box-containing protein